MGMRREVVTEVRPWAAEDEEGSRRRAGSVREETVYETPCSNSKLVCIFTHKLPEVVM